MLTQRAPINVLLRGEQSAGEVSVIESGSLPGFDDLLAVFNPWGRIRWPRAQRQGDGSRRCIAVDV